MNQKIKAFAIPGHTWCPDNGRMPDVIRKMGKLVLRRVQWQPCFPAPSESVESIRSWTKERHDAAMGELSKSRDAIGNAFERAKVDRDATLCLAIQAGELLRMLTARAKTDEYAFRQLAKLVGESVTELNELARARPEKAIVAESSARWPVMMSTHPLLSDDPKTLFAKIRLGKRVAIEIDKAARWPLDFAGKIAIGLQGSVMQQRKLFPKHTRPPEAFNDDTAEKWWRAAEALFLASYPFETLHEFPELKSLIPPSKRKSPGRTRHAIIDIIHARFVALAPAAPAFRT